MSERMFHGAKSLPDNRNINVPIFITMHNAIGLNAVTKVMILSTDPKLTAYSIGQRFCLITEVEMLQFFITGFNCDSKGNDFIG